MRNDVGRENVYYIHVTLLPHISTTGELKTKPTQQSVRDLRGIGIQPDCIICRSDFPVPDDVKAKIAFFCDVQREAVIPLVTAPSVYEVPLILQEAGLGRLVTNALHLDYSEPNMKDWRELVELVETPKEPLSVAVVGKYADLPEAYISVKEALLHAGLLHDRDVQVSWVPSEEVERYGPEPLLRSACGIVVPGGFGPRGVEGMIAAARYARENRIPYLGLCLGMQLMVIEVARNGAGLPEAHSAEFDPETPHPVIDFMPDQRDVTDMGGTMRLGIYPCRLVPGTIASEAYGTSQVQERHRHRLELNNAYREALEEGGLRFSGLSPDQRLVEIAEVADPPLHGGHPVPPRVPLPPQPAAPPSSASSSRRPGTPCERAGSTPCGTATTESRRPALLREVCYTREVRPCACFWTLPTSTKCGRALSSA